MAETKAAQNNASRRRLVALDDDDLAVISAHVQDAAVVAGDILWRQAEQRLVIAMRRIDCEDIIAGDCVPRRLISALRFDRVLAVKTLNIRTTDKDAVLSLLAVTFSESNPPSGEVLLTFSGGGTIRLDVECLECEMKDLGPAWATSNVPRHD